MANGIKVTTLAGTVRYENVRIEHEAGVLTVRRMDGEPLIWAGQPWLVEFTYE